MPEDVKDWLAGRAASSEERRRTKHQDTRDRKMPNVVAIQEYMAAHGGTIDGETYERLSQFTYEDLQRARQEGLRSQVTLKCQTCKGGGYDVDPVTGEVARPYRPCRRCDGTKYEPEEKL